MITSVFKPDGYKIAELTAEPDSITWRLSAMGAASIRVSHAELLKKPGILYPGNMFHVTLKNGMVYAGVCDFPVKPGRKTIEVSIVSPDKFLESFFTETEEIYTARKPGYIVNSVLANAIKNGCPVGPGNIDMENGTAINETFNAVRLSDVLSKRGEYRTGGDTVDGRLYLTVDWADTLGIDRQNSVLFEEGSTCGECVIDVYGPVENSLTVFGYGVDWASRLKARASSQESIGTFGIRQGVYLALDIEDQATLNDYANRKLAGAAFPKVKITVPMIEEELYYTVGDTVALETHGRAGYDYSGPVRVVGIEYNSQTRSFTAECEGLYKWLNY